MKKAFDMVFTREKRGQRQQQPLCSLLSLSDGVREHGTWRQRRRENDLVDIGVVGVDRWYVEFQRAQSARRPDVLLREHAVAFVGDAFGGGEQIGTGENRLTK